MGVSERRACQVLEQPRSTQRHVRKVPEDEERLVGQIVSLATRYGRYGYRRITALLRNDGSCLRLRPERKDHVWSYDMAMDRTSDGRPLRILVIIDEYTRECLSMHVARRIRSEDVLEQLYELFLFRGVPEHIRSDNGAEFTANAVRNWLEELGVATLYIEPGSPWENGYVESFIGKLRDELLNGEVLDTLTEAKVLVEGWRKEYNRFRPHSSLGYRPPAPEAFFVGKFTQGLVH
jgi:putative transposase